MRGRHYIDQYGHEFTEEQKTAWFSVSTPPSRSGHYELRDKKGRDGDIFKGQYLTSGKWSVAYFDDDYTLLKLPPVGLEWRGLIADPQILLKKV